MVRLAMNLHTSKLSC